MQGGDCKVHSLGPRIGAKGMRNQTPKGTLGCLTTVAVVIVLVAYSTTGSLNPLTVFASHSLLAKISVTVLGVLLGFSLLQMLSVYLLTKSVEIQAGRPAEDVVCPGCGLPLIMYASSHGMPITCPKCRTQWHNGPACYNKDKPSARTV